MAKSKVKIKWNPKAFSELRNSDAMLQILEEKAQQVEEQAGDGYVHHVAKGKFRASAFIRPITAESEKDNLENNTLLKALNHGKD